MTRTDFICTLFLCSTIALATLGKADDDLLTKCKDDFTKVTSCLTFATGKANQPTKDCCTSVTEIRKDDPACLCFFIQMASNGSVEQVKNLGIKLSQLLLIPTACKLVNSSISDCPKVLHLPANSPAAAVFTNLTTPPTVTPSTGGATTTAPTATKSSNDTGGSGDGPSHIAAFMVAIVAVVSMSVLELA